MQIKYGCDGLISPVDARSVSGGEKNPLTPAFNFDILVQAKDNYFFWVLINWSACNAQDYFFSPT